MNIVLAMLNQDMIDAVAKAERRAEAKQDALDRRFLTTRMTEATYDAECAKIADYLEYEIAAARLKFNADRARHNLA